MSTVDTNSKLPVTIVVKRDGVVENTAPVTIGGTSPQVQATMTGPRSAEIAGVSPGFSNVTFSAGSGSATDPVTVVAPPVQWTVELTIGAQIPK